MRPSSFLIKASPSQSRAILLLPWLSTKTPSPLAPRGICFHHHHSHHHHHHWNNNFRSNPLSYALLRPQDTWSTNQPTYLPQNQIKIKKLCSTEYSNFIYIPPLPPLPGKQQKQQQRLNSTINKSFFLFFFFSRKNLYFILFERGGGPWQTHTSFGQSAWADEKLIEWMCDTAARRELTKKTGGG